MWRDRESRGEERGSSAHSCRQNCKACARMSNLPERKESLELWLHDAASCHSIAASAAAAAAPHAAASAAAITAPWNFNRANFTVLAFFKYFAPQYLSPSLSFSITTSFSFSSCPCPASAKPRPPAPASASSQTPVGNKTWQMKFSKVF